MLEEDVKEFYSRLILIKFPSNEDSPIKRTIVSFLDLNQADENNFLDVIDLVYKYNSRWKSYHQKVHLLNQTQKEEYLCLKDFRDSFVQGRISYEVLLKHVEVLKK